MASRGGHAITDPVAHSHPDRKVKNALFYRGEVGLFYRGELALKACINYALTVIT